MTTSTLQSMIAENDTLIITAPCYIMKDEDWDKYTSNLSIPLDEFLRSRYNFGEVIACDTGVGDWSNEIVDSNENVLGRFCADAGMVIVCTASDFANYGGDEEKLRDYASKGLATIIPDYSGTIVAEEVSGMVVLKGTGETSEDVSWTSLLPC